MKDDIKVSDKVKLKSVNYIKRKFHLSEDQELDISRNQGKIFKVVEIPDGRKSVILNMPIFDIGRPMKTELHEDAVYLYKKSININLPEQLFEI